MSSGLRDDAGREQARWGAAQLDLAADLVVDGDAMELTLEYNADMFHSETAERIAGHFLVRRRPLVRPCVTCVRLAAGPRFARFPCADARLPVDQAVLLG